jgi:hypothetical protein
MELWESLGVALRTPLAEILAAFTGKVVMFPEALATLLWNDLESCSGLLLWSQDFVEHSSQWIDSRMYWYYGWLFLIRLHWWTRYWALFPLRLVWNFFIRLHIMLWPLSVFYPTVMEIQWPRVILLLFHTWRPAHFRCPGKVKKQNRAVDKKKSIKPLQPPKKEYRGLRVTSAGETNGLVNSVPLPSLF